MAVVVLLAERRRFTQKTTDPALMRHFRDGIGPTGRIASDKLTMRLRYS